MRRRELLTSGVIAAAAYATGGPAGAEPRKLKFVITGGHPGDPEYGCGGTIARLTAQGHEVVLLYLNNGEWETSAAVRMAEGRKACEILKARAVFGDQKNGHSVVDDAHYDAFAKNLEAQNPDAVFTHWMIDNHPDHRAMANLTFEAWKQGNRKFALYYYEVSDGEDTVQFPSPTHYVDITAVAETKRAACFAHASQSPDRYYGVQDAVAVFRGMSLGVKRAEGFVLQLGGQGDVLGTVGL